ncbi:unnamed protein product [Prunus armeniaca]
MGKLMKFPSITVRLAKLAVDKVLTAPCGTSVLYPRNGGNLHYFTAVTPCAVLDIIKKDERILTSLKKATPSPNRRRMIL